MHSLKLHENINDLVSPNKTRNKVTASVLGAMVFYHDNQEYGKFETLLSALIVGREYHKGQQEMCLLDEYEEKLVNDAL